MVQTIQKTKSGFFNISAWKLRDIILVSMLSVFFAILYIGLDYVIRFPRPFFALFGLGEFNNSFFAGIYYISATFAAYIMRKPGIALVTGLMSALVQVPLGNPWGVTLFMYGLMQGAGAEIGYLIFRYKKYGWASILASAAICLIFSFALDWFVRGLWEYRMAYLVTRFSIRFASALFFAGVLSKLLADRLAKAGVLKSYPIGENYVGNINEP